MSLRPALRCIAPLMAAGLLLAGLSAAAAQAPACVEPVRPACLGLPGGFASDAAFRACQDQVQSFIDDTQGYVDCLTARQKAAVEAVDAVVRQFSCIARDGRPC